MRKIDSAEAKEKRRARNNIIIAVVMISLIGLSSLGYSLMNRGTPNNSNEIKYGGLTFGRIGDYWATIINQKQFIFYNLPQETANVSIEGNFSFEDYYGKVVYIINPNPSLNTISYALDGIALRMQDACMENLSCEDDLPTKTCDDTLIVFRNEEGETRVTKEKNCVFIEGDFFSATDKLIYRMLSIT